MIKRICPQCGKTAYSADEGGNWECKECGYPLTPEDNRPVGSDGKERECGFYRREGCHIIPCEPYARPKRRV
jgi:ribosomal protein L37AE/L43A